MGVSFVPGLWKGSDHFICFSSSWLLRAGGHSESPMIELADLISSRKRDRQEAETHAFNNYKCLSRAPAIFYIFYIISWHTYAHKNADALSMVPTLPILAKPQQHHTALFSVSTQKSNSVLDTHSARQTLASRSPLAHERVSWALGPPNCFPIRL